ncbi:MAG: two-component system cell cycle sensor histidine kinase/response regulator CckA [Bacteroidia bacterium]|jgi:two-component system cell cycle sensor histidine kinase/response regulator CckA
MTTAKQPKERITILLFEDNLEDADFVGECLEQSNLIFKIHAVKCLADGLQALQAQTFDLILLDLSLPDSCGIATLQAVVGIIRDEVIIVLTDADDEELSFKTLREGAQDYLCKDRLSGEVLRRSIRSAIERANRLNRLKSQTRELQHSAELLRRTFDANTDAMLILTQEYEIKFLNPAAARLLEVEPETLVGEIFPFEVKRGKRLELEVPGPEESTRLVELNALDLVWERDSALLVILRDVTLRRTAEFDLQQEKKWLALTLDSIAGAVIAVKPNSEIERMN